MTEGARREEERMFSQRWQGGKTQGTQTHETTAEGLDHLVDELERIKKLAGLYDDPHQTEDSMGENLSYVGTQKAQYQKKHNIRPGTEEWFKLWFAQPRLTGENPMPKNK